jgi:hypothetical protein
VAFRQRLARARRRLAQRLSETGDAAVPTSVKAVR